MNMLIMGGRCSGCCWPGPWARPLSKFKITSPCESSLQATMARGHCRHEVVNLHFHLNSKMAQNAECITKKVPHLATRFLYLSSRLYRVSGTSRHLSGTVSRTSYYGSMADMMIIYHELSAQKTVARGCKPRSNSRTASVLLLFVLSVIIYLILEEICSLDERTTKYILQKASGY